MARCDADRTTNPSPLRYAAIDAAVLLDLSAKLDLWYYKCRVLCLTMVCVVLSFVLHACWSRRICKLSPRPPHSVSPHDHPVENHRCLRGVVGHGRRCGEGQGQGQGQERR